MLVVIWVSPAAVGAAVIAAVVLELGWWALPVVAACAVLAVAAAFRLGALMDRRAAAGWQARQAAAVTVAAAQPPLPAAGPRPAIEGGLHINLYGADAIRAAAIIRHAIGGPDGNLQAAEPAQHDQRQGHGRPAAPGAQG